MKNLVIILIALFTSLTYSQTFHDDFFDDRENDFPSKWELLKGGAFVSIIDGSKVVQFDHRSIITPKIGSTDYLSDNFTIEFEAFFDKASIYDATSYTLRFWPGTNMVEYYDNEKGKGSYGLLKIYRHGIRFGNTDEVKGSTNYDVFKRELEDLNATWKVLTINYNRGELRIMINKVPIIHIPDFKLIPSMVSVEGYGRDGSTYLPSAIRSFSISGIKASNTDPSNTKDSQIIGNLSEPSNSELDYNYILPTEDGLPNQILQTNGSGIVTWVDHQHNLIDHEHETDNVTNSENISNATVASGLEAIDEGNGIGWRLIGRNPELFGNIGKDALDFSQNYETSSTHGATGLQATAIGSSITASGFASISIGSNTVASGILSTAIGYNTIASGYNSIAIGYNTRANSYKSIAIGNRNIGGGNPDAWLETDPLFEIGNGTESYLANALTVLKNGTIIAPSFDMTEITNPKSLITKEYADANYSSSNSGPNNDINGSASQTNSGLESIDEGNGVGWRLIGSDPNNYGRIATGAVDLSIATKQSSSYGSTGNYSTAFGQNNIASGNGSTAMGFYTTATGDYSIAMGENTKALAKYSFATGLNTEASGVNAIAMGFNSLATNDNAIALGINAVASGSKSMVLGNNVKANAPNSIAMGYNTTASGEGATVMGADTKASAKYATALGFKTEASGFSSTALGNETIASGFSATSMGFQTIADDQFCTVIGRLNDNSSTTTAIFQVGNGTSVGRSNAFTILMNGNGLLAGSLSQNSDRRLKTNINTLSYGLNEILQLKPKSYNWKNGKESQKLLGLIAQDVQPIIKELVHIGEDKDKILSINYTALIPVLIKAMQEQQEIIDSQNDKIVKLNTVISEKNQVLKDIDDRVKQIESFLKQEKL